MNRFVILTHDHPFLHWDFMLESEGVLRTWRLLREPDRTEPAPAEPLGEHRLAYLDYEGPVSEGRGEVRRWDAGEYELLASDQSGVEARLFGSRLRGVAALSRDEEAPGWTFSFSPD